MIGTIQKKEFSKNGAPKYQISGTWYFVNRSVTTEFAPGVSVEFEYEEFGEDRGRGRPKAITKWRQAQQSSQNGSGASQSVSTITDVDILRSVSNIVGSACAAGMVKDAAELEKWCLGARMGLSRAMQRAKVADPDFDDDLPQSAYASLPGEREPGSDDDKGPRW